MQYGFTRQYVDCAGRDGSANRAYHYFWAFL